MRVKGTVKVKKKAGCFTRILQICIVFIIIAAFAGMNSDKTNTSSSGVTISPTNTVKAAATSNQTAEPTASPNVEPSAEPTAEPFTIILAYPELGEYGQYYTFNENVKKATKEDKETIIQCFVPSGDYTITNEGDYPTCVIIYSNETVISEEGWEEPKEVWSSKILKVGDSCEITVNEGYYINLQENDVFNLVRK